MTTIGRTLLWIFRIVAVLGLGLFLAFQFTPWPSVAIIQGRASGEHHHRGPF